MTAPLPPTTPPVRPPTRRRARVLRIVIALAVVAGLGTIGVGSVAVRFWSDAQTSTVGDLDFTHELRIPELDEGRMVDGRRVFELTADEGTTTFLPGTETPTAGYDGSFLGPTLRMHRGEQVEVRVRNDLDELTTTHWHGMHLPAAADGGPHSPIRPGETWTPTWTVDQPAATLWYHPHPHGDTEDQVHWGLAGMVQIDDGEVPDGLPSEYGVDDVPVIVQDRHFDGDGRFADRDRLLTLTGRLGDQLLVNGTWDPFLDVTTERVRLRLLNGSTARVYSFGFADDRSFDLVATDGGLLPAPTDMRRIQLSPGERAEIVVTVEPGERTILRSFAPDLGLNPLQDRAEGGDDTFDVLQLRAADDLRPSPEVPDRLADAPDIEPGDAVRTRSFELSGTSSINSRRMDIERIDAVVRAGTVEEWRVQGSGTAHSFHVHDVQFRVLSVGGDDPPPELRGWKDTVFLRQGETYRLLIRFGTNPDDEVPFMFHCHLLRHEDDGMMGQLLVTDDGEGPDAIDAPADHAPHGGGGG